MTSIVEILKKSQIRYNPVDMQVFEGSYYNPEDPVLSNMTMLKEQFLDKNSSIVVTCADPENIRTLMLAAQRTGMLSTGQFVFYNVDLFGADNLDNYQPWSSENVGLIQSFLLQVKYFVRQVKRRMKKREKLSSQ